LFPAFLLTHITVLVKHRQDPQAGDLEIWRFGGRRSRKGCSRYLKALSEGKNSSDSYS